MDSVSPLLEQFLQVNTGGFQYNIVERGAEDNVPFYKVVFFVLDPTQPIPDPILFTFYEVCDNGESTLLFVLENYQYRCNIRHIAEGKFAAMLKARFDQKLKAKARLQTNDQ